MRTRPILSTAIVALVGAVIGSFAMMLYASTHFTGVAGPGNTPPQVYAAPISSGGTDQARIVSAVKRVAPSVVSLNVNVNGQRVVIDPFAQFFGQQGPERVQRFKGQASGSGFVYARTSDSSGLIVTNAHVVRPPAAGTQVSSIEVVFPDGQRVPGHVYGASIGGDIALVKVDGVKHMPPPLEIADSSKLQAGQFAIAIGEPLELKQSVSLGVVSGFNREEPIAQEGGNGVIDFKGLLQTSAPINPGNSGGPLIDEDGRLIGVNQSTASPAAAQGIGFAIPSNAVKQQVAMLQKNPGTHQGTNEGFIGFLPASLTQSIRAQLNYNGPAGVAVMQVVSGGSADQAGLQPGDVIQKIDGKDVANADQLRKVIAQAKPGSHLQLEVWSAGVKKLVSVAVSERPANVGDLTPPQQGQESPNSGP